MKILMILLGIVGLILILAEPLESLPMTNWTIVFLVSKLIGAIFLLYSAYLYVIISKKRN